LGTKRAAIGSFFPCDGALGGLRSDGAVEIAEGKGICLSADPRAEKLYVGGILDTADGRGFDCDAVMEEAEDGVLVDDVEETAEARRCITVFTVTLPVSFEAGNNENVGSGLESTRKFRLLDGMGGIIRALYIVLWILEASDFVF
jgi:hypothetical protein